MVCLKRLQKSQHLHQISRVDNLDTRSFLQTSKTFKLGIILFSVAYKPSQLNIKRVISKHWHTLNIISTFKNTFNDTKPILLSSKTRL